MVSAYPGCSGKEAVIWVSVLSNLYASNANSRGPIDLYVEYVVSKLSDRSAAIVTHNDSIERLGGSVAEWLRRWTRNSEVASSIPGRGAVE